MSSTYTHNISNQPFMGIPVHYVVFLRSTKNTINNNYVYGIHKKPVQDWFD